MEICRKRRRSASKIAIPSSRPGSELVTPRPLRWLLDQQNVAAIPRSVSKRHAQENFDIFDFALSAKETARIDGLTGNRRLVNLAMAPSWDVA